MYNFKADPIFTHQETELYHAQVFAIVRKCVPLRATEKTKIMERKIVGTCSLIVCLLLAISNSQRFQLPSSNSGSPGLNVDKIGDGKVFTATGTLLYRLNSNLELEQARNLTSEAVNISLSTDGRWLVVCLTDLSCEVYNATNLSAQPVFRRENAITSAENVALFAAEDSFYVGGVTVTLNHRII